MASLNISNWSSKTSSFINKFSSWIASNQFFSNWIKRFKIYFFWRWMILLIYMPNNGKKLISSLMPNLRVFDIENSYTGVMNYFFISLHKWWLSFEVLERKTMFFSSSIWWSWKFTLIFEEKIRYFIVNPIMRSVDLWKNTISRQLNILTSVINELWTVLSFIFTLNLRSLKWTFQSIDQRQSKLIEQSETY
jgi:hypothetical protein